MTYYLLFILYLFWTKEMTLDRKQIQVVFLKFKMGGKAAETTSTMHLAQELLTNVQAMVVQELLQRRQEP